MLTFSSAQIQAWVLPLLLPFLRVLGLFTSAPVLSAKFIPMRVRVVTAFYIALCAQASANMPGGDVLEAHIAEMLLLEIGTGLAIGFVARAMLSAVELGGELIGLQMGLNFAGFFDPVNATQSSTVGRLYGNLVLMVFVLLNGHLMLIELASHPVFVAPSNAPVSTLTHFSVANLGGYVFSQGLLICLPSVVAVMIANLTLGVVSRAAPQLSVFSIGFPITLSIGLIAMVVSLPMTVAQIETMVQAIRDFITAP